MSAEQRDACGVLLFVLRSRLRVGAGKHDVAAASLPAMRDHRREQEYVERHMIPVSYYAPNEITSPKFAYAFAKGCGGCISEDLDYLHPGPVALFGSPAVWPVLRLAQADGREWYYSDHAYFHRHRYFRITRNNYQHDGIGPSTPDRFLAVGRPVQPWRTVGAHVVVCPNSPIYCRLFGFDVAEWIASVVSTLKAHTDREIRVRWKHTRWPITDDLVNAWAVVVFSSAAALDALIAGIPVFVLAPFAAGARMGLSDVSRIESPTYPDDREQFLWALADHQWTLQEIYKGQAWRELESEGRRAA